MKKWYIDFIEKDKKNFPGTILYFFLCLLSLIYGFAVGLRNFLYDKGLIASFSFPRPVISIGSLCWGGSGKTTLTIYLYRKLASKFKIAILRRGYGDDEGRLLKEETRDVFSSRNRVNLARKLVCDFDVFILDDGFQYRKLKRALDIVVMAAREFRGRHRLIPAHFFREPKICLRRADILILNYKGHLDNPLNIRKVILNNFPHLKVYFARYKFRRFSSLNGKEVSLDFFKQKRLAAFSAIGYPEGFFNKLKELKLNIDYRISYPDHYQLKKLDFKRLEEDIIKRGINDLVITSKDRYRFCQKGKLNIFVMEIEMEIEQEDDFLKEVERRLTINNKGVPSQIS